MSYSGRFVCVCVCVSSWNCSYKGNAHGMYPKDYAPTFYAVQMHLLCVLYLHGY